MSKKKKPTLPEPPTHDCGLGAMLAAARKGDHGVLADWVEEHLHLDDLAACLRAGCDDPRTKGQRDQTTFVGFRYRQLDRNVLLFVSEFEVYEWGNRGKKEPPPEGHVLCLCLSDKAPKGPKRIERWFVKGKAGGGLARLWADLGREAPADLPDD
ncbi:MAG: hypothetical protein U0797_06605 [Gemmataceae bacterium]